jgi:hypothetical protein
MIVVSNDRRKSEEALVELLAQPPFDDSLVGEVSH